MRRAQDLREIVHRHVGYRLELALGALKRVAKGAGVGVAGPPSLRRTTGQRTQTVRKPSALAASMSLSIRSPIMAHSRAGRPRPPEHAGKAAHVRLRQPDHIAEDRHREVAEEPERVEPLAALRTLVGDEPELEPPRETIDQLRSTRDHRRELGIVRPDLPFGEFPDPRTGLLVEDFRDQLVQRPARAS